MRGGDDVLFVSLELKCSVIAQWDKVIADGLLNVLTLPRCFGFFSFTILGFLSTKSKEKNGFINSISTADHKLKVQTFLVLILIKTR